MDPFLSHVLVAVVCLAIGLVFGHILGQVDEAQRALFARQEFEELREKANAQVFQELKEQRELINNEVIRTYEENREKLKEAFIGSAFEENKLDV